MDDRIRASDAERERVTERLREHFAQGRLSPEELDERISAALGAKTLGDLRRVLADLPEPALVPAQAAWSGPWAARPGPVFRRRGPRLFPLALLALIIALAIPGAGWAFFAFLQFVLLFWLVACLAGIFAVIRFRRRWRHWHSGDGTYSWHQYQWHG